MKWLLVAVIFAGCGKEPSWKIFDSFNVRQVLPIHDSLFYVGTYGKGLFRVENGKWEKMAPFADDEFVMCLKNGPDSSLWACTARNGAYEFTGNEWRRRDVPNAWDMAFDSSIWFCCRYKGICLLRNREIAFMDRSNGLPDNEITCIEKELSGRIWIGTVRGGACFYQDGKFERLNGVSGEYIRAFLCDSILRYVGTWDRGLNYWNGSAWELVPEVPRPVVKLAEDSKGQVWAGTWGFGVRIKKGGKWETLNKSNSPLPDDHVIDIRFSPSGRAYLATARGLAIVSP